MSVFNENLDRDSNKEICDISRKQREGLEETYKKDSEIKETDKIDDTYEEFDDFDEMIIREEYEQKEFNYREYTDEEIKQLMDEDTLEISYGITEEEAKIEKNSEKTKDDNEKSMKEKVISAEENGQRNSYWVDNDGIHHADWKNDAVEGTEQNIQIGIGTLLERHTFKGIEKDKGSYMALYGTRFEDKQLNYLEEAYDKNIYIVNEPINAIQSEVGQQGWQKAHKALQYKINDATVQDLLDSGILSKISQEEAEKIRYCLLTPTLRHSL